MDQKHFVEKRVQKNGKKRPASVLYALGMLSYNMEYMVVAYLTYALTNSYAISALTTGMIFMFSRFFDGFTDVVAGFVIDKWSPKMGKARVYDLLHIPLWICLVLTFSVPNIGLTGKIIWVFIFYNLLQSVIATFMNVAEPLRLERSFQESQRSKVMAVTTILTLFSSVAAGIAMPLLIEAFGARPHGWTIISAIFAVPFGIFGFMRFLLLPELPEQQCAARLKPPTIKESLYSLAHNKYALLNGGLMICWAMTNTLVNGVNTYYFQYVYGDISAASIVGIPVILSIVFIIFIPKFVGKFGEVPVVRAALISIAACYLCRLLAPTNIILLAAMMLGSTCGLMVLSFMKPMLTISCMKYGKWKLGNSVEAAYSTVNSLADKIGLGLGSVLLGAILQAGGYDGTLAVQSQQAVFTIKMLYTVIPAALMGIALVCMLFFNIDKEMPKSILAEQ